MKTITQAMTFYHLYINNPSGRELNAWAVSDSELKECEQQETRFDTFVANLQKNLTDEYEVFFPVICEISNPRRTGLVSPSRWLPWCDWRAP